MKQRGDGPQCECCGRLLEVHDHYRNVCPNCGLIVPDDLRSIARVCRTFGMQEPIICDPARMLR